MQLFKSIFFERKHYALSNLKDKIKRNSGAVLQECYGIPLICNESCNLSFEW